MSKSAFVMIIAGVPGTLLMLLTLGLSRHKKSRSPNVIGSIGVVEIELAPEGAVIVNGDLWRARLLNGSTTSSKSRVRVVGVQGHLLLVEQ